MESSVVNIRRLRRRSAEVADSKSPIATTWWLSKEPGTASVSGAESVDGLSTRPSPVSPVSRASTAATTTTGNNKTALSLFIGQHHSM